MSKNIEDEIQAALHAQPATGSLDPRLDFFIKQAEVFIEDARQTILSKMPEGDLPEHKAVAYQAMQQTIASGSWNVQLQVASIEQSIDLTMKQGERMFQAISSRPQNTTEEQISRRWDNMMALLDSLGPAMAIIRIKEELSRAVQPAGGDQLDLYLLRNGESLLYRYLESRKAPLEAYFRAVKETALEYERSVVEAVDTVLLANRLADTWPGIKDKLSKQLISLNSLAEKQALSWEKSSGAISVQSDSSGAVNVRFNNMDAFRAWARTPH